MSLYNNYEEHTGSSYLKRFAIGLVDALLAVLLMLAFISEDQWQQGFAFIFPLGAFAVYRLVLLLLFNRTVGMVIFQSHLLNGNYEALSLKEKFLAAIFILYQGVNYYDIK